MIITARKLNSPNLRGIRLIGRVMRVACGRNESAAAAAAERQIKRTFFVTEADRFFRARTAMSNVRGAIQSRCHSGVTPEVTPAKSHLLDSMSPHPRGDPGVDPQLNNPPELSPTFAAIFRVIC